MIRRLLGLGAAACLLAGAMAGGASAATTGSIWQVVPSENPQPHLVTDSSLASVSMGSATDGWAVGSFLAADALGHPLAEHWNGTAWTRVPAPEPSGTQAGLAGGRIPGDSLSGAASLTGGLVFAVGARDVPGQCCLRTLGLMTASG